MKQMITASKTAHAITVIGYCLLVIVLAACSDGNGSEMRAQLEELERQNRADSVMTNDSLAKQLVKYFDRHGTSNERMRAHYILGRTYADLGESPRAIDAYLDAIDQADTTAADCDYRTLGCVYGQMGGVFHRQLLLSNEIEARQKSYHFFHLAGDTLGLLSSLKLSASAYYLLNKRDSAEILLKRALHLYEEYGYVQEGVRSSTVLMSLYANQQDHLQDLKFLIDRYEAECDLFDENHELHSKRRIYYYYKGRYYEELGNLDSAEVCYRKVIHPNMAYVAQNSMYKGLLSVFTKRHQADSIAKYAQLYCMVNDSSIALKDQELTVQMASSYQYNRFQKQAYENEKKAENARYMLLLVVALAVIMALVVAYLFAHYKRKKQLELLRYQNDLERLTNAQKELMYNSAIDDDEESAATSSQQEEIDRLQESIAQRRHAFNLEHAIVDQKLRDSAIVQHLRALLAKCPQEKASLADMKELQGLINEHIPSFFGTLNPQGHPMNPSQYEICLLIRAYFTPAEIAKLLGRSDSYVATTRKRILMKVYGIEGSSKDLDAKILSIY